MPMPIYPIPDGWREFASVAHLYATNAFARAWNEAEVDPDVFRRGDRLAVLIISAVGSGLVSEWRESIQQPSTPLKPLPAEPEPAWLVDAVGHLNSAIAYLNRRVK